MTITITLPPEARQADAVVRATQPVRYVHRHSAMPTGVMECLVTVFSMRSGREIVVLTELADNPGPSVTNSVGHLVPAVYAAFAGGDPSRVLFLEHYRSDLSYRSPGEYRESFDQIEVVCDADTVRVSGWKFLSKRTLTPARAHGSGALGAPPA